MKKIPIEIGPMSPKLSDQLHGFGIPRRRLFILDRLAASLSLCYIHGLITDVEHTRASKRLMLLCSPTDKATLSNVRVEHGNPQSAIRNPQS